jgi:hypothetical protein
MSFKGKVVYDATQHCVLIVSGNAFTPKVFVLYSTTIDVVYVAMVEVAVALSFLIGPMR